MRIEEVTDRGRHTSLVAVGRWLSKRVVGKGTHQNIVLQKVLYGVVHKEGGRGIVRLKDT